MNKADSKTAASRETYLARLVTDERAARQVSDLLSETLDPAETVCAAFEQAAGRWQVDIHFQTRPDEAWLHATISDLCGPALADALTIERVAPRDWVKESLAGLKPVRAGRFVIHGAHDRTRIPSRAIGVEIEAATAFGTGHHGTTRGCLLALDELARRMRPHRILDLGTGSGILAIAAAKLFHVPVLATDIDRNSVRSAAANARLNRVGGLVTTVHAADLRAPQITARAPFDLVMANILLGPLQRLAAPLALRLSPNARLVLSGILEHQANAAISAYQAQGLVLERKIVLDGWVTPIMTAAVPRFRSS